MIFILLVEDVPNGHFQIFNAHYLPELENNIQSTFVHKAMHAPDTDAYKYMYTYVVRYNVYINSMEC